MPPGSLAFDIGANRGHYSETLYELGARVVAVEPTRALAETIRRHYPKIAVEEIAVAATPSRLTLRLGAYDGHSTLSEEWTERYPDRWVATQEVDVTTLDALIAHHGKPSFVKIDVEGYEAEVLRGLTVALAALSFEYQCSSPHIALAATNLVEHLDRYEFALARADSPLGQWGDVAHAHVAIEEHASADPNGYGDIYARQLTRDVV